MMTSHQLARELLSRPDGFIVANDGEKEYVIDNFERRKSDANLDDSVCYWSLNIEKAKIYR